MHGRIRALALVVGLAALPLQASPTYADGCELVGSNGSFIVKSGSGTDRSWRILIDGVTYTSDKFDRAKKEVRKKSSSSNKKKKKSGSETYFTFKDVNGITRTPNNGSSSSVDAKLTGEINESNSSGFAELNDRSNNRKYRIEDGAQGTTITCT